MEFHCNLRSWDLFNRGTKVEVAVSDPMGYISIYSLSIVENECFFIRILITKRHADELGRGVKKDIV